MTSTYSEVINICRTLSQCLCEEKITSLINSNYQGTAKWCLPQTLPRERVRGDIFSIINLPYPKYSFLLCSFHLKQILPCTPQIKSKPNLFIHPFTHWVSTNIIVCYRRFTTLQFIVPSSLLSLHFVLVLSYGVMLIVQMPIYLLA